MELLGEIRMLVGMNQETGACASSMKIHCESSGLWLSSSSNSSKQLEFEFVTVSIQFYTNWSLWCFIIAHIMYDSRAAPCPLQDLPTALMHELQVTRLGIKAIKPCSGHGSCYPVAWETILTYFETAWRSEAASKDQKKSVKLRRPRICRICLQLEHNKHDA